jgi:hypothetical protein
MYSYLGIQRGNFHGFSLDNHASKKRQSNLQLVLALFSVPSFSEQVLLFSLPGSLLAWTTASHCPRVCKERLGMASPPRDAIRFQLRRSSSSAGDYYGCEAAAGPAGHQETVSAIVVADTPVRPCYGCTSRETCVWPVYLLGTRRCGCRSAVGGSLWPGGPVEWTGCPMQQTEARRRVSDGLPVGRESLLEGQWLEAGLRGSGGRLPWSNPTMSGCLAWVAAGLAGLVGAAVCKRQPLAVC